MTNAELIQAIKAEIERRKKALHSTLFNDEYNDLLSFLDTLESEKPMQEGLEEEINRTYRDGSVADTSDLDHNSYENIARHFAKWQKGQMMKEAVEGEVYLYHSYKRDAIAILVDIPKETLGDKVRIIIVKEDEK